MKYNNPIVKGFYPDPSVCKVGDKYYLACSSMQYFPGVPLFESEDLINWHQIGHCITRPSQIKLDKVESSGGVFAPTIRYNNGRFYMTTTNNSTGENFYIWTDDIYGEWSEPIYIDQRGIDPSLYFEDGRTYFISTAADENGVNSIYQCEIDIENGHKFTESTIIWQGTGGRYLEGPHMYKINGGYYLVAAEGGTEYGHMVTYARGNSIHGPFENYKENPVLTNRNLGGYQVQGVGHGDLVQDNEGNWWMVHLAFRQIDQWLPFHHLGRETFLTPIRFKEDGWFEAGENGTTAKSFDIPEIKTEVVQKEKKCYTFENTEWNKEWCYLRQPKFENYELKDDYIKLKGTELSIDDKDSPTFIGIRQMEFNVEISCEVTLEDGEAGIVLCMDENHHYDLLLTSDEGKYKAVERLNIGDIKSTEKTFDLKGTNKAILLIKGNNYEYSFYVKENSSSEEVLLGSAKTRYLSTEVAGGFTGVVIGLYCHGESENSYAEFKNFKCEYVD